MEMQHILSDQDMVSNTLWTDEIESCNNNFSSWSSN